MDARYVGTMPYPGNIPNNAAKDAKYSLGLDGSIRLRFSLGNREETLLTTRSHPALARRIGEVKAELDEPPGGVFYLNEYGHLLVKAGGDTWFAGTYQELLEFEFQGQTISPRARPGMRTGDRWTGPHVGIRYALTADGRDIFYRRQVRPGVERRELLSQYVGASRMASLAAQVKQNGGRLYVNEAGVLFAPVQRTNSLEYVYLGELDLDEWFPEPRAEGQPTA